MNTVFIGGSREVRLLNNAIRARLDNVVQRGMQVVIGDAPGADAAVQSYLAQQAYGCVVVYCMDTCRNNLGRWPERHVDGNGVRGFNYYARKDVEMARAADCGLMIWNGRSRGTLANVRNLIADGKPVLMYCSTAGQFVTVRTDQELDALLHDVSIRDADPAQARRGATLSSAPLLFGNE